MTLIKQLAIILLGFYFIGELFDIVSEESQALLAFAILSGAVYLASKS